MHHMKRVQKCSNQSQTNTAADSSLHALVLLEAGSAWEGRPGESDLKKRVVQLVLVVGPRTVEARVLEATRTRFLNYSQGADI